MWFWLCSSCLLFFTREIERIYVWFQSAVDFSTKLVYSIFAFQQKNWTKNRQQDDTGHMGVFHYSYWKLSQNCYKILCFFSYVMPCTIWYHLYNLKHVKNTHGGVLLSVKLQAEIMLREKLYFSEKDGYLPYPLP